MNKTNNKKKNFLHLPFSTQIKLVYALISTTIFLIILMFFWVYSIDKTPIFLNIGNKSLNYIKIEKAKEQTALALTTYAQKTQKFTYKGKTIELNNKDLGITINIDSTINNIPRFNFLTILKKQKIQPSLTIDKATLINTLETKFNLKEKRAKNAKFTVENNDTKTASIKLQKEQEGIKIDEINLLNQLKNNIYNLKTTPITIITTKEIPLIKAKDIENKENLVNKSITLKAKRKKYTLNIKDHINVLKFKKETTITINNKTYQIALTTKEINELKNKFKIQETVKPTITIAPIKQELEEQLLKDITYPPSHAKIYRDENDKVIIEGKGEDGKTVIDSKLEKVLSLALENNINEIEVPITTIPAKLDISSDLQAIGIKELLATGHSSYYGSPRNRKFNIKFGTAKYNGLLIAPGEEFSFNKILGSVDAKSGFKPEKVIKQNKIKNEYGGGICQVSTTLYRAALLAGLPITERKPHSWKVSYYGQTMGHGLDATIYPGVSDVKFINDTGAYILIQAYVDKNAEDYFKLYGTKDGRQVKLSGPFGGGLSYRWEREITKNGETKKETIYTKYKPIPPNPTGEPKEDKQKEN